MRGECNSGGKTTKCQSEAKAFSANAAAGIEVNSLKNKTCSKNLFMIQHN